jgi:hypothetical protein
VADAVQTFRAISWLIVKWTLVVVAALVGIAAVVAGGLYGFRWYTHERHAAKVQFIVEYDQKKCAEPFPLHIIVGNLSGRTINKVSFWVEARKPGHSTNLTKFDTHSDDKIIPPEQGWGICWRLPQLTEKVDPQTLQWMIVHPTITFAE